MKLLFTRRRHLGSVSIRLVTWSLYSHVDLIINPAQVIGATAFKGVAVEPIEHRLALASKAVVVDVPVLSAADVEHFAYAQLGKPYDWSGVIGIGLHRNWQEDDSWSCAELVAAALRYGGANLFDDAYHHRVTPQHLLMLNYAKERVK